MALSSNNDNKEASYDLQVGNGTWALYTDAFIRDAEDYETASFINDEGERVDSIKNSFVEAQGGTLGVSYQFDNGFIGCLIKDCRRTMVFREMVIMKKSLTKLMVLMQI